MVRMALSPRSPSRSRSSRTVNVPLAGPPPNIVLIVTDDMGYGDIGVHDGKDIPTPNIDALMKSGVAV